MKTTNKGRLAMADRIKTIRYWVTEVDKESKNRSIYSVQLWHEAGILSRLRNADLINDLKSMKYLKFVWRSKRPRIANMILKKSKVGGPMQPSFRNSCTAVVIKVTKAACCWWRNRRTDAWNRVESSEMDSHTVRWSLMKEQRQCNKQRWSCQHMV